MTALPFWSVSWNGPPTAAGCTTLLTPPIAQNSTSRPTTRLEAKAVAITNGRAAELMSGTLPVAGQKQAAKPVLIISKNTWLP